MRDQLQRKSHITALALLVAAVGIGSSAIPSVAASAAPASETAGDYRPSEWDKASDVAASDEAPRLTDVVEQPDRGTGSELPLGLGLVGLGLLVLVCGFAAQLGNRRRLHSQSAVVRAQTDAQAGRPPRRGPSPAQTRAGS